MAKIQSCVSNNISPKIFQFKPDLLQYFSFFFLLKKKQKETYDSTHYERPSNKTLVLHISGCYNLALLAHCVNFRDWEHCSTNNWNWFISQRSSDRILQLPHGGGSLRGQPARASAASLPTGPATHAATFHGPRPLPGRPRYGENGLSDSR